MEEGIPGGTPTSLHDSHICRLCAEENSNGYPLFDKSESGEPNLSDLINTYLPLKITDDGKYPRWICPGCHLQVESTVQFFNLVAYGQEMLRICYDSQCKIDNAKNVLGTLEPNSANRVLISTALSGENLTFHIDLIEKMSVTTTSDTTTDVSVEKPKRKRGRPPKPPPTVEPGPDACIEDTQEEVIEFGPDHADEPTVTGRRRRQIKVPSRFQEALQGKELEKVYMESGVIENDAYVGSDVEEGCEITANGEKFAVYPVEVIGHLQDNDGGNLGDLVIVNNKLQKAKKSKKKTRFMCDICKVFFCYEQKFLQHRFSHYKVRFECIQCLENFAERNSLIQHQAKTCHKGEGIIEGFPVIEEEPPICEDEENAENYTDNQPASEDLPQSIHYVEKQFDENLQDEDALREPAQMSCNLPDNEMHDTEHDPNASFEVSTNLIDELENYDNVEHSMDDIHMESSELNTHLETTNTTFDNNAESMDDDSSKRPEYKCNICDRQFSCRQSYVYHKESEHNNGRRFLCSKCSKSFKNKILLQRHQLVHSNVRPFACDICKTSFKTKTHLVYHKVSHTGEKNHHCKVCQQSFLHKNSLTLHMRCHTGQKPYKCSVCEKTFTQQGNMQEHMRIHTGECPFECHICGRKFKTSSQVRTHIKRHQMNKPLKCNFCDKTFVQLVELRNHQRRHKNDKRYRCDACGKCFIDMNALKKHFRQHTGEKPYSCTECPRRFADQSNLNKHLKIHVSKQAQMEYMKSSYTANTTADQTIDEFTQSSAVSRDNFILTGADVNSIVGENSMWDLIEEDVCRDSVDTTALSAVNSVGSNQQLVNITYQDPDDPLRSKTTLFVVQNTTTDPGIDKLSTLEEGMALAESCNDEQLLSNPGMFLTNSDTDPIARQTVILNIQNPVDFNLEEACELFRSDDDRTDNDIRLVTNGKSKVGFLNYTDALDIPD